MKKVIITLSREYGSGGLAIGQQLAEALGIPFYDKKLPVSYTHLSPQDRDIEKSLEPYDSRDFSIHLVRVRGVEPPAS